MWVYSVYSLHAAVQWCLLVSDQLHFASRLTSVLSAGTKVNHWTSPEEFAPLTISCGISVHTLISSGWSRIDSDLLWRWCDECVGLFEVKSEVNWADALVRQLLHLMQPTPTLLSINNSCKCHVNNLVPSTLHLFLPAAVVLCLFATFDAAA